MRTVSINVSYIIDLPNEYDKLESEELLFIVRSYWKNCIDNYCYEINLEEVEEL